MPWPCAGSAAQVNNRPLDIELEVFVHVLADLAQTVDRVAIVGASFGAEAALCVATRHPKLDAVVAIAPTTHVWPGRRADGTPTSHWTWRGLPVPFVEMADGWVSSEEPPAFRSWYELSLDVAIDPDAGRIPIENFDGQLVIVAGGDDQVWPSADWAVEIERRRASYGRSTTVVSDTDAGHRPILPGEARAGGGMQMQRGGSPSADARLGAAAWPHIVATLGLRSERRRSR